MKLGMAKRFSDILPSMMNLTAREGNKPTELSRSMLVWDNLIIAVSDPEA